MTNQSIAERMVVSATVTTKAETEDGFVLELEIPQFRSNYPTKVTRVNAATAKLLAPRPEPYTVILVRQNLKKDKQGTRPYDYYWGLEGLASATETAVKAAAVAAEPQAPPRQSWDDRTVDIEAAWAINQAREALGMDALEPDELLKMAQYFLDIKMELTTAMRSGVHIGDATAQPATSTPSPATATESASAPPTSGAVAITDLGALYMEGMKLGYNTAKSRNDVPGFQAKVEAKDYQGAYALLVAAKEKP